MGKFKTDGGQLYYKALFYEETLADKTTVVYTLKRHDHLGYPSLYRLYMEMDDPTEYNFAVAYLDGWHHWEMLTECNWFKPHLHRWRRELEVRTKARSLLSIRETAASEGKEAYQANKFLLSTGWKDKSSRGAGRPSKDEINKVAKTMAQDARDLEDEFQRIQGTA